MEEKEDEIKFHIKPHKVGYYKLVIFASPKPKEKGKWRIPLVAGKFSKKLTLARIFLLFVGDVQLFTDSPNGSEVTHQCWVSIPFSGIDTF